MVSQYEQDRLRNIENNKKLLEALGLDKPIFEPKEKPRKPKPKPKDSTSAAKRKRSDTSDELSSASANKAPRTEADNATASESGTRRSARNQGKVVDYKTEKQLSNPVPISFKAGIRTTENEGPLGRQDGKRIHDPKSFGPIPGIEVGTWWETRQGCSTDAIHGPWVGGIAGSSADGAYSVALSGGYDDDVDLGYAFTYTGSGGRDLKGTKNAPKNLRTAPQSSDQTFDDRCNRALQRSAETKKPVRVIRGYKLKSPYAPSEGYRYDGLYRVEKAWIEKGLNPKGYLVCKFAFKRLLGQPPLPRRDGDEEAPGPEMSPSSVSDTDVEEGPSEELTEGHHPSEAVEAKEESDPDAEQGIEAGDTKND